MHILQEVYIGNTLQEWLVTPLSFFIIFTVFKCKLFENVIGMQHVKLLIYVTWQSAIHKRLKLIDHYISNVHFVEGIC